MKQLPIDPSCDPLVEPLRREADAMAEPFSDALHGRIMRRVSEARIERTASSPASRWAFAAVAFATAVIVIFVSLQQQTAHPPVQPKQVTKTNLGPLTDWLRDATHPVELSMNSPFQNGGLTSLDQDVNAFGKFMINQLDRLPEQTSRIDH